MSKKCKYPPSIGHQLLEQKLEQNNLQFAIVAEALRNRFASIEEMRSVAIEKARREADLPPCPPVCPPVCIEGAVIDV